MRQMRIAYLSTVNSYYGGEVCFQNLAKGMCKQGHEIFCVVKPTSTLREKLQNNGVTVFPVSMVDWYDPLTVSKLWHWLISNRIEILHTHLPSDYYIAAVATLGTGVCNVGTRHILRPISHPRLKRPFLNRFKSMICVSDAVKQQLLSNHVISASKVVTIHNGIDLSTSRQDSIGLRAQVGISDDVPVIGYVGRLSADKGLETLLRAAACLFPQIPDLRIFILGDEICGNAYTDSLRSFADQLGIGPRTTFFGYVNRAAAAAAEFDVQVICSNAEPFGLVTIEAMAHGCPVIVTNTGGSTEIVDDGQEGFLVRPGDVQAVASRLRQLLTDRQLSRAIGENGRRKVLEKFSSNRMVTLTESLYHRVLE